MDGHKNKFLAIDRGQLQRTNEYCLNLGVALQRPRPRGRKAKSASSDCENEPRPAKAAADVHLLHFLKPREQCMLLAPRDRLIDRSASSVSKTAIDRGQPPLGFGEQTLLRLLTPERGSASFLKKDHLH